MTIRGNLYAKLPLLSILGVTLLLMVIFSLTTKAFLTPGNMFNLAQQLAPNLIVAAVMTLVITTGGIDLSVGSVVALASAMTALLLDAGMGSLPALLLVLAAGAVFGAINGYVIAYQGIPPFIVTLASMTFIRGFALFLTGGYSIAIASHHWIVGLGRGTFAGVPISAIVAVAVVILGAIIFTQTRYGTYVTGIGANEEAVRRMGIDTKKVKLITYLASGISAALAGMIIAARLGSGSSNIGVAFELDIIAAVVLGGTSLFGGAGTIFGSLIGVVLIGVINNGLTLMHVSPFIIQIIEGLVLLLAIIMNTRVLGRTLSNKELPKWLKGTGNIGKGADRARPH